MPNEADGRILSVQISGSQVRRKIHALEGRLGIGCSALRQYCNGGLTVVATDGAPVASAVGLASPFDTIPRLSIALLIAALGRENQDTAGWASTTLASFTSVRN